MPSTVEIAANSDAICVGSAGDVGDWYFSCAVSNCRKSACVRLAADPDELVLAVVEAATEAVFTEALDEVGMARLVISGYLEAGDDLLVDAACLLQHGNRGRVGV